MLIKTEIGMLDTKMRSTTVWVKTRIKTPQSTEPTIKKLCLYVAKISRDKFAMISPKKEIGPTRAVAVAINSVATSKSHLTLLS